MSQNQGWWEEQNKKLADAAERIKKANENVAKILGKGNPKKVVQALFNSQGVIVQYGNGESILIKQRI